jgi:8-oxo-dGTP pyrophosphatase MutT (NUDIX family)
LTSRKELINCLQSYTTAFPAEAGFIPAFLSLLQSERCYHRDHLPGHMTGSAWILNHERTKVALLHHAKLNKWLQPGGHADGDEDILHVALREAEEETGLQNLALLTTGIFDIDIHLIPARADFPAHDHYDIRFAFITSPNAFLQVSNESHAVEWINLHEAASYSGNNVSILRMVQKTISN